MIHLEAANIFNDHMVLQRDKAVRVWGKASPKNTVLVCIQGKEVQTQCNSDGKWELILPKLSASVNETLRICSGDEEIIFTDVLVGEVWLAGGQSNMEFQMFYDQNYEAALSFCDLPFIRIYDVPKAASEEHLQRRDYSLFGFWREANKENLKYFSAVAYYFAKALSESLQVPIGIISCNWGGSRAACWMDRETLENCGPIWLEDYKNGLCKIPNIEEAKEAYFQNPMTDTSRPFDDENRNRLMRGLSLSELEETFRQMGDLGLDVIGPWHEWRPNGLYETMLKKIMPYTIKGAIYYQGESDDVHPEIYANMLEGLILCWRKGFGDDFPFLMTQLAPFGDVMDQGGTYYPILREQQEMAAEKLDHVWCASIGDVGNSYDIHPKEKRPVGERLALLARGHIYGENILCDGPVGMRMSRTGQTLVVDCSNASGGLFQLGETVSALELYRPNGELLEAPGYTVSLEQNRVMIKIREGLENGPYQIRFAKTPYYHVNIYNMSGIPMKPFVLTESKMRHFTKDNTARSILERPEIQKYLNIFVSKDILSGITEEYMDCTLSELEHVLEMPWGGPFIPEIVMDAAERVIELVEDQRFEFLPLWHHSPEGFIPNLEKNNKENVCLMRIRTKKASGVKQTKARPVALICPGGGYELLSVQNEGIDLAECMEQNGYAAYILLYRVSPNRYPEPQKDLALAIKYLRANAKTYHIDPERILIMGSSAAGHLCVSESAYHNEIDQCLMADIKSEQPELFEDYHDISARADAVCCLYPVIDFMQYAHEPSFQAISGGNEQLRNKLSIQKHIPMDFPMTFLWACCDDPLVPYQNSELMADALKEKGIRTHSRIYPQGGHGCGLAKGTSAEGWVDELLAFLKD